MTDFPESKLDWLVEKFGEHEGWFNASKVRTKGNKKIKNDGWKQVMDLAVEKGLAYSSDSYPKAPKNSIAFNLPKIPEFFDNYIFNDIDFIRMPEAVFISMGWKLDSPEFNRVLADWIDIHNLLCGLQYHEIFDDQLEFILDDPERKRTLIYRARRIASTYELVKAGWGEIVGTGYFSARGRISPANYNELFLRILWDDCKYLVLSRRSRKPNNRTDRSNWNLAGEIERPEGVVGVKVDLDKATKNLENFMGRKQGEFPDLDRLMKSGACYDIKEILRPSSNPTVVKALKELDAIVLESKKAYMKPLRKRADKKPSSKN
jgi:hypothetical protein